MQKYVLKNLKNFITKETAIFIIVIICQVSSILLSLFSYGVFQNYKAETNQINIDNVAMEDEDDWIVFNYELDISAENPVEYKVVYDFCNAAGNLLGDKIANLFFESGCVTMSLAYENGTYKPMEEYYKNSSMNGRWAEGEWFSDEQINNREKVCVITEAMKEDYTQREKDFDYDNVPLAKKEGDDYYITLGSEEYKVIGFFDEGHPTIVFVPWGVLSDDYSITCVPEFSFNRQLTQKEYNSLVAIYENYFPDRIISTAPELELYDPEEVYYYKTNMAISLFIAIVSSINFALLFNYIFDRRRHTLAVLRLTGCTANRARRMYLSEVMLIMIPLLLICTFVFHKFILPWLDSLFPYINQVYGIKIYSIMAGIYFVVSYIIMNIMIILHLRKTPVLILNEN